jgi:hypothetical protein
MPVNKRSGKIKEKPASRILLALSIQTLMVATSVLNKQSGTADRGGLSRVGLGSDLTAPCHKRAMCYKMLCRKFFSV